MEMKSRQQIKRGKKICLNPRGKKGSVDSARALP
jgi:hypothetical protein